MRRFMYVLFIAMLSVGLLLAEGRKINRQVATQGKKLSAKAPMGKLFPVETNAMKPYAVYPVQQPVGQAPKTIYSTDPATNRQVATSANGYGWLNSNVRSIDRYAGPDADTGDPIDFVAIAYRGTESDDNGSAKDIRDCEVDVSAGLASGTAYTSDKLNDGIDGIGGRYPCMVALDRPFPSFNQYKESSTTGAAISHPYTICSYGTYGDNGNVWTTPDYQMDVGWLAPTIQNNPQMTQENRLWNGPVAIVKDGSGEYRYLSVYEEWYSDQERQLLGVQSEKYIFTAHSDDPTNNGWTFGWDEGFEPVRIDTHTVSLPRCGVSMNSDGFGVIAGPGHLGWHNPDSGYYYNKTRITYAITEDYGHTWSQWDTVGLVEDLGFQNYIYASEKLIITNIVGNDTIWYQGPAFLGTNFDMSVLVDDNKTIYVVFNSLWGGEGTDGWYPSYKYSGVWLAKKPYGGSWEAHRIAYNNGIWQGDDIIEGMSNYFFDSECQISMDEQGHLYAAWLDRRHNDVQVSQFNRYSDPETYGSDATFKTDIYASHSIDGGVNWSDPINCTDSPALDEYELNMSKSSANSDVRGNYGKIWYAYCLADTANGDPAKDAYIELTNFDYIGEASNFNEPAAIDNDGNTIVTNYGLQQNYPNPFNPATTIEFTPQKSGKAKLIVYNAAGQQVATLFNGQVQKNTPYRLTFDGSNMASGIYFYKLQMNNKTEIKKMVLIK